LRVATNVAYPQNVTIGVIIIIIIIIIINVIIIIINFFELLTLGIFTTEGKIIIV